MDEIMQKVIQEFMPIEYYEYIPDLIKALHDAGYVHKDSLIPLDEKELALLAIKHHKDITDEKCCVDTYSFIKAICETFALKLPEKRITHTKTHISETADEDIGFNECIDLVKKMNRR